MVRTLAAQLRRRRRRAGIQPLRGESGGSLCASISPHNYSVYQELGDGQVMEAMEKHVHRYSEHCARHNHNVISPAPDLILFQRATEHVTRLCRAMVRMDTPTPSLSVTLLLILQIIPGCHALLLGVSGSGRKSICRLVAYMIGAQVCTHVRVRVCLLRCFALP